MKLKKYLKKLLNRRVSLRSTVKSPASIGQFARIKGRSHFSNSILGRYSYILDAKVANCTIGSFTCIGPGCRIGGLGLHPIDRLSVHPVFYSTRKQVGVTFCDMDDFDEHKRTYIGSDVWIGAEVLILDGVNIGDGCIIGAGAVVVNDLPPFSIAVGVPAKVIKKRFSEDDINLLLKIKWWDFDNERLKECSKIFKGQNVKKLHEVTNDHIT